jgi:hypothetical protein
MKSLKIGITVDLKNSIFTNGINQNGMYLAMLFNDMGHDATLIAQGNEDGRANKELNNLNTDIKIKDLVESISKDYYDVIIGLGFALTDNMAILLKRNNKDIKFVKYKCGADFFITGETIIYGHHEKLQSNTTIPPPFPQSDQIWYIPQQENISADFFSYLDKGQRKATVVPFVWDPIVIEKYTKQEETYGFWKPRKSKNIGIMEPNLSLQKNLLYPLITMSRFMEDGYDVDNVIAYSSVKFAENKDLIKFIRNGHPDLIKKTITLGRFPTTQILNTQVDAVLSWQIENPLNYLYLDVAWLGWPIIHNAHLCKDIGYYYPNNDTQAAANAIQHALENHTIGWRNKQRKLIKRYTQKSTALKENYQRLLDNLMSDTFKKQVYNAETNTTQDL